MPAVIFEVGEDQFELPAADARRLERLLRQYDDPGGYAWDLADRIERAGPRGHSVYPTHSELPFLLRALREAEGSLGDQAAELLRVVLAEAG